MLTVQGDAPELSEKVGGVLWFEKGGRRGRRHGLAGLKSSSTSPTAFQEKNGIAGTGYKSNVYGGLGGTVSSRRSSNATRSASSATI
jgi:hypothetical protein